MAFFTSCLAQKTKPTARNADPKHVGCLQDLFSQKTQAPARNEDANTCSSSSHVAAKRGGTPPPLDAVVLLRPLVSLWHWAYPWYQGAKLPWCHGAMVPWRHGAMVPWYHGTMVPWHHRTMAPWQHGTMGWKCEKFQPGCCEADFGSRNKILGYPLGRSAPFFGMHLFRLVPGLKIDFLKTCPRCPGSPNWSRKKLFTLLGTKIRVRWPKMLRGRFWHENQDFEVSVGAICIIFRDLYVPTGPGTQNRLFEKSNRRNGSCCGGVTPPA